MSTTVSVRPSVRTHTKKLRTRRAGLLASAIAGVIGITSYSAPAATFTWDINDTGNWSLGSNWVGNLAPSGFDGSDILVFGGVAGSSYTSTVDSPDPFVIGGLTFNSASTNSSPVINFTNVNGIAFNSPSAFITQNGAGAFQVDAPIILNGALTLGGTGTGRTTLNGLISGGGDLNFTGGTWRIGNIGNTFTGAINIGQNAFVELRPSGPEPQFVDLLPASTSTLLGAGSNAINIDGGTFKITTVGGSTTPDFQAANIRIHNRVFNFGTNGGVLDVTNFATPTTQGGNVADGTDLVVRTTTGATAPAIVRWNGGQQGLSEGDDAPPAGFIDPDWQLNENVLRLDLGSFPGGGAFVSDSGTGPLRVEMSNGAMIQLDDASVPAFTVPALPQPYVYVMPLTLAGPAGQNPTSGPNGTVHSGNTKNVGRIAMNNGGQFVFEQGLFLEGALQMTSTNGSRALDGNITVSGTASGNAGFVTFSGRSTGTNWNATSPKLNTPGDGTAGNNVLWVGFGENDTLTIQDGGIAVMDIRIRTDQNFHHGTVLNARSVINAGGTLRMQQSISAFSALTAGQGPNPGAVGTTNVGNNIVQGSIEGQGSTAKDAILDIYLPFDATYQTTATGNTHAHGGVSFEASSQLIVNGTGTGGLMVRGLARPNALFQGGAADPVSNLDKVNNLLSVSRLSQLTGTGGYLTPAPAGVTYTLPVGGEWAASVPVGLKIVDSNTTGVDVSLGGSGFSHNIFVDAGATLDATGSTLGPAAATPGLGLVHGRGTIAGGAIINTGATIAGGFEGVGTLTVNGNLTINGAMGAELVATGTGRVAVGGNLTLAGSSTLNVTPTDLSSDFYTLASYSGTLTGTFSAVNGAPAGYVFDYGAGANSLITFFKANSRQWRGNVNSNFDTTTDNWYPGLFANGNAVQFDDTASTFTVDVSGTVSPDGIKVLNNTNDYTIGGSGTIAGSGGLTKMGTGALTISGSHTYSGPVVIAAGTVNFNGIVDTAANHPSPLGAGNSITLGSAGNTATLHLTAANGSINRTINVVNAANLIVDSGNLLAIAGSLSGSGTLTATGGTFRLGGNSSGFTGQLLFKTGAVEANAAGSLGAGQVTIGEGTAASSVRLNYNAAGAYSGSGAVDVTTGSIVSVGASLGAGDRIRVNQGAVLLPNAFGASLNRSTNLDAQAGAIVAETAGGQNNAILNRGTASDLFFGISGNVADSMTLGATPGATAWRGLSTTFFDNGTLSGGTITAASNFDLQALAGRTLTIGGGAPVTITGGPKTATVQGNVHLAGSTNSYNGINFSVSDASLLQLMSANALGSGANRGSVTVAPGGTLRPMDPASINGNVTVNPAGIIDVVSNLSGTGVITVQNGGIMQLNSANSLSGTQLTPASAPAGAVLRLVADDIALLNNVTGSGRIFELYGSGGNRSQSAGISLNGSLLTQDNNDTTYVGPLSFGPAGGTLASTSGRTLSYAGNITGSNPVTIGSTSAIDGHGKLGTVALGGSVTAPVTIAAGTLRINGTVGPASQINIANGTLDLGDGAVLNKDFLHNQAGGTGTLRISAGHSGANNLTGTGSITLGNGRELVGSVDEGATELVNTISIPIHIEPTGGTLTADREGPAVTAQGLVHFTDVRLAPNSTLTMRRINENSAANITLLGNATIVGNNTNNQTRVANVTGAGHTLTMGGTQNMRMVGALAPGVNVRAVNSATVQLNASSVGTFNNQFALNGNTYEQVGNYTAAVSGAPLPGLTGSGATTLGVNPGTGTFIATGGSFNLNATAPDATLILNGSRVVAGANSTVGNLTLATSTEFQINGTFSVAANLNVPDHGSMVIQPNANDSATAGLGRTSFFRVLNTPPTVTNGMVAPNIVRRNSDNNEGFFLTYDATNGFMTAPATSNILDLEQPTAIVQLLGADYAATQAITADRSLWALKTNQNIDGSGATLTIGSGGIIFYNGGNGNATIAPNINFADKEAFIYGREGGADFTANPNNKNRDTLGGNVIAQNGLTKFGGGDLWLNGFANDIRGPITIHRGRLVIGSGNGIGNGNEANPINNPLTINGNSATIGGNSNHHPSVLELNGQFQQVDGVWGNGNIHSQSGFASFTINKTAANGGIAVFTGAITGNGGTGNIALRKMGPGTQILASGTYGVSNYTDGTDILEGALYVNNTAGSGTGSGSVNVFGGATLGGSGTIVTDAFNFRSVNVQNGGHLSPGPAPADVGTLTMNALNLDSALLDFEGDSTGMDRINIGSDGFNAGGLSTISFTNLGGLETGDYLIIDYNNSGGPFGDLSMFQLAPAPAGHSLSLIHDSANMNILLHVNAPPANPQWILDANGSWNTAANWAGGVPNGPTAIANFLGKITAPRSVSLDGNKQVNTINFDNANKYTIAPGSGGTLTVSNSINVATGSHEISAGLSLAGNVTKSGAGKLTISGAQTHAAGSSLAVTAGEVELNSNAGVANSAAGSNLALSLSGSGSKITIRSDQDLRSLVVSQGEAGTQTLDLASGAGATAFTTLRVYAADLNAAKSSLYASIRNANAAGAANPLDGIIDSNLHAGAGIGLAVIGDHVTIRPTRVGDLNLDGLVSIADFIDLAAKFNTIGTATWQEGDLNYDGSVTISDFIDLASNFNSSYAGGVAGEFSAEDHQLLANFASSIGVDASVIGSAVPEPGTIGVLSLGALGLLARRRRRVA